MSTVTHAQPGCVTAYAEYLRAKKRDARYVDQVQRLLVRLFHHVGVDAPGAITARDIESWLEFRTNIEGVSGKTHNNERAALSAFFGWCRRTERTMTDPTRDVLAASAVQQVEYDDLTIPQIERIIAAAESDESLPIDHPDRRHHHHRSTIYRVAYATGMRRGSLRALRVGDFIDGPAPVLRARAKSFKTGKPHEVPLTDQAARLLRRLTAERDARDLLWEPFPHDRVITGDFHAAGVSGSGGLQRFRVTVATMLAESGASPAAAQAMLGHAHVSTTLKHYTRSNKKKLASEVSRLPSLTDGNGYRPVKNDSLTLDAGTGKAEDVPVTVVDEPMHTRPHDCERGTGREIPGQSSGGDTSALGNGGLPVRFPGRDPERDSSNKCRRQESNLSPRTSILPAGCDAGSDPAPGPRTRHILIQAERASAVVADARRGGASRPALDALTAHAMTAWVAVRARLTTHPTPTAR